jgi:hypothetical protein
VTQQQEFMLGLPITYGSTVRRWGRGRSKAAAKRRRARQYRSSFRGMRDFIMTGSMVEFSNQAHSAWWLIQQPFSGEFIAEAEKA